MTTPKFQHTELLHLLITKESVTTKFIQQHLFILNVTSVISYLRSKGVNIFCEYIHTKNRYGRKIKYGKFILLNKKEAIKIYNQLNREK